jgi:hypothetical protein
MSVFHHPTAASTLASTGNTTFESDLTSETTSEDHDVISNQQDSNNFSYLKLHLPNKGLRFGQWSVNHLTNSNYLNKLNFSSQRTQTAPIFCF